MGEGYGAWSQSWFWPKSVQMSTNGQAGQKVSSLNAMMAAKKNMKQKWKKKNFENVEELYK